MAIEYPFNMVKEAIQKIKLDCNVNDDKAKFLYREAMKEIRRIYLNEYNFLGLCYVRNIKPKLIFNLIKNIVSLINKVEKNYGRNRKLIKLEQLFMCQETKLN